MQQARKVQALFAAGVLTCAWVGEAGANDWKCESKFGPND